MAAVAVLLAVTTGASVVGTAVLARHRAQAAADLAALAAAAQLAAGQPAACAQAGALAAKMGGAVTGCHVEGLDVVVTVDVAATLGRWQLSPARASARAGPAER